MAEPLTGGTPHTLMRAVVLREPGPPEALRVERVPMPNVGSGEILVRVRACGVDGHDVALRAGKLKAEFSAGMVPGHEIAGDVIRVGPLVRSLAPGDRVCCKQTSSCGYCAVCRTGDETMCKTVHVNAGGLAEYVALPEDAWVKIADDVDYGAAAVLSCAVGTVYHAMRSVAELRVGEKVLVTGGGGGLGLHAVELGKVLGAQVFALTHSPAKREAISQKGADHVLLAEDNEPLHSRIGKLTDGQGVDVVIDTVGAPAFALAFRCLAVRGRYVLVGQIYSEKVAFHPLHLFSKEQRILGSNGTRRRELEDVIGLARQRKVTPVISRRGGLKDIVDIHRTLESGTLSGRAVVDPSLAS